MIIEEAMLFFRVKFQDHERIDPIVHSIETLIPESDRFSSPDKHEWHIHNSYRRHFDELISKYMHRAQMSLF